MTERLQTLRYPRRAAPAAFSAKERRVLDLVNRKIAGEPSLDAALSFLFDATRPLSPCDRLSIAFLDESGERLVSQWTRATYEPVRLKTGYSEALERSSLKRVIEEGRPRIITDLSAYLVKHPESVSTRLLVQEGIRSSLTCPLAVDGRIVGVLFRSSLQPAAYDDRQVALHLALAERLSQAVEKAWRLEQLAAANKAYAEMLGFVSHELRGPLSSMILDWDSLRTGLAGPLSEKQRDIVDRVQRQSDRLLNLIRDYLELARVEQGALKANLRPGVELIRDVFDPAVEAVESDIRAAGLSLRREAAGGPFPCACDPELIKIVLLNLLGNAAKYGKKGGLIRLNAARTEGGVKVAVWNEGAGFRESDRPLLFRRFSRLPTPEFKAIKGSGVGLYTCARILHLHGSRLVARSEYGLWAEFSFELSAQYRSRAAGNGLSARSKMPRE